jgi:hypothetical protein
MTGNDLIVAAPWIIFGAALLAVCIRLLRSRRAAGQQPGRPDPPSPDPAGSGGPAPGRRGGRDGGPAAPPPVSADRETTGRPYTQEAQCAEKNTEARRR